MRVEHVYGVAPRELLDVLTDETFLAARSARFGGSGVPTARKAGPGVVVTVPRQLPVAAVPGPFRSMVGDGQLVQIDTWTEVSDGRATGTWTTDVGGAPLDLHGTHEIVATDDGCRYVVTAEVKVRIRFIGAQVEGLIRQQLADLVSREQGFSAAWLAGVER